MQLDNRTLMFSSLLVTTVLSLLDILIWRMRTTFPGFGRWAMAHALFAPALLLFRLRMILPDWVTIVVANFMATALTVMVIEAAREFRGLAPRTWQAYAAGAVNLALILYFRYVTDNLNVRILVAGLFMGCAALFAAKVLLTEIPKDQEIGMKYTGWLLVICGLLQLWRGIYYFMQPPSVAGIEGAGPEPGDSGNGQDAGAAFRRRHRGGDCARRVGGAGEGRPGPDAPGDSQPVSERARCDAARREADHRDGGYGVDRGRSSPAPGCGGRPACDLGHPRHWHGHG
jgi:hypothetical protein